MATDPNALTAAAHLVTMNVAAPLASAQGLIDGAARKLGTVPDDMAGDLKRAVHQAQQAVDRAWRELNAFTLSAREHREQDHR